MSHMRIWSNGSTLYFAGQFSADDAAFIEPWAFQYGVSRPEQAQQQATKLAWAFKSIYERVAKDAK